MKNFIKANTPRFWFFIGSFVTVFILIVGLVAIFSSPKKDYLFKVGDEKVTVEEYNRQKTISNKKASYIGDSSLNNEDSIKNAMIERLLIKRAASEYGITVSDEEVTKMIEAQKDSYNGDVNGVYAAYQDSYGYTKEEFFNSIRYSLLKDKLFAKIINTKSGDYIYLRFNENNGVEEITGLTPDKLDGWAKDRAEKFLAMLKSGQSFETVYNLVKNDTTYYYPASYVANFRDINSASDFIEPQKSAILNLKVGEYSDIIKTETFYCINYVKAENQGRYNTWEEFISDYRTKYVSYQIFSERQLRVVKNIKNHLFGLLSLPQRLLTKNNVEAAKCSSCTTCKGAYVKGIVRSVDETLLPGALITVTNDSDNWCNESTTLTGKWCGRKSGSIGSGPTNAEGMNYVIGGASGLPCFMNCKPQTQEKYWRINFSKDGYYSSGYMLLDPSLVVNGGSGGRKDYVMNPIPAPKHLLTVNILPVHTPSVATPTGAGSYDEGKLATAGFADVITGWKFVNWSGDPGCGTSMIMNGPKTCTANFEHIRLSCSVTPETGLAPLVVRVEAFNGTPPYTYNMGEGTPSVRDSGIFYYTYSSSGTKSIKVTDSSSPKVECPSSVTVNSPQSGSGGEIAP